MSERTATRRTVLKMGAATLAAATVPAVGAASDDGWTAVESPTGNTLHDVETGSLTDHSAPMDVTNDFNDVAVTGEAVGLTVGGGGAVFDRDGDEWSPESTPTGANLTAVVRGDPDVAVGASGTILER